MKKLLTMMLCSLTILSLAACSKALSEDEVRGEQITNETPAEEEVSEEMPAAEETPEESPAEKASEEASAEKTEEKSEEETSNETVSGEEVDTEENGEESFSMGDAEGLVYENDFIGLGCKLDEGWSFYTDEQIMELNNYTADIAGEEFEEMLANAQVIYDMFAVDERQMNNINVNLEKIDNRLLMSVEVSDIYEQNLPMLKEIFNGMGYVNVQAELITVTIDGEEFSGMSLSGEINGLNVYQKSIGVKCVGYLASISVTTYMEDTTDDIFSKFYLVD